MKILVCIKQVPGTAQVEIDPTTGTLKRDGVPAKMNPFDLYALETAIKIKEQVNACDVGAARPEVAPYQDGDRDSVTVGGDVLGAPCTVTVLTMGPPQCEKVVREAFMMGADRGVILSDRAFGGADVLMTSYTLSQGVKKTGPYDLIICGKQTTDGDTAQVGAEMAEFLGIPHVVNVKSIGEVASGMTVTVDLPDCEIVERIPFPSLMTVEKGIFEPRLPSYKLKCATAEREITWLSIADLDDADPKHYGLNGSPTQVKRIFPPEAHVEHVTLEGDDVTKARKLADILESKKFLQ